jgi:hypothetical protein
VSTSHVRHTIGRGIDEIGFALAQSLVKPSWAMAALTVTAAETAITSRRSLTIFISISMASDPRRPSAQILD